MSVLKIKREDGTWESISSGSGSSVDLDDTLTQSGKAADAKVVGDKFDDLVDIIVQADEPVSAEDGTLWLDLDEESSSGVSDGGSYEIPTFNLTEMGLPTIPMDGTYVVLETNTSTLRNALDSGLIKLTLSVDYEGEPNLCTSIERGTYNSKNDNYQMCAMVHGYYPVIGHKIYMVFVNVFPDLINACIVPTGQELPDAEEATF